MSQEELADLFHEEESVARLPCTGLTTHTAPVLAQ